MNPFTKDIEALQREYTKCSSEMREWKTKLDWFDNFKPAPKKSNVQRLERELLEVTFRLRQAQQASAALDSSKKQLELEVAIGIDPRSWFSSERAVAKRKLADVQQKSAAQLSMIADIHTEITAVKAQVLEEAEAERRNQEEISRARAFDPLLAQSAIAAMQSILDRIEPQLANLRQRSNDLDKVLLEPLKSLRHKEAQRTMFLKNISRAEAFETALTRAASPREKAQIHARCEETFGVGKPASVLRQNRAELRRVDDAISKLQTRIDGLAKFASWDIRSIIIDANNLCYEGNSFLGLLALKALVPVLAQKYAVTLVFDATIRRKLGMSDRDIGGVFLGARVHIVASMRKADETVLSAAEDDNHSFVLSNDRFADYPEKLAVKEGRILRHEIVSPVIYIHELQIDAKFECESLAQGGSA